MAELWLRSGVDPDAPDELVLAVIADPDGGPGDRAVARLGDLGYEGEDASYLVQTDGWAERWTGDGTLTVDIVVYPAVLESLDIDPAAFPERSSVDSNAIRLLRTNTQASPADVARAPAVTVVFTAGSDADRPLIIAPPPDTDSTTADRLSLKG